MRGVSAVLCGSLLLLGGSAASAQSSEEILRRFDALERENAALRQEVHQIKAERRPQAASARPAHAQG